MTTVLDAAEGVRREVDALRLNGLLESPHVARELEEILYQFVQFWGEEPADQECEHQRFCVDCSQDVEDIGVYCAECYGKLEVEADAIVKGPAFDERAAAGVTA